MSVTEELNKSITEESMDLPSVRQCTVCGIYQVGADFVTSFDLKKYFDTRHQDGELRFTHPDVVSKKICRYAAGRGRDPSKACLNKAEVIPFKFEDDFFIEDSENDPNVDPSKNKEYYISLAEKMTSERAFYFKLLKTMLVAKFTDVG